MTDEKKPQSSEQKTPTPPPTTEYQRRDKESPLSKQERHKRQ